MRRLTSMTAALALALTGALAGCSDQDEATETTPDGTSPGPGADPDTVTEEATETAFPTAPADIAIPDTLEGEVARVELRRDGEVPEVSSITSGEVDHDLDYEIVIQCLTSEPGTRASLSAREAVPDGEEFVTVSADCDGSVQRHTAWPAGTRDAELIQLSFRAPTDDVTAGYAVAVPAGTPDP